MIWEVGVILKTEAKLYSAIRKHAFICARLHLHCSHVMRLYRTNLIINNLKERTNHGKTIETSLARDPNPLWRGRSQIHEENGESSEMEQGKERRFSKMV